MPAHRFHPLGLGKAHLATYRISTGVHGRATASKCTSPRFLLWRHIQISEHLPHQTLLARGHPTTYSRPDVRVW
jgi:hypothetical protein